MEYLENRENFYRSEFASRLVDQWKTGVPFAMRYQNKFYDAFLFYSADGKNARFHLVKALYLVEVSTGEILSMAEKADEFGVGADFPYTAIAITDVSAWLKLSETLQDAYISLRRCFTDRRKMRAEERDQYLNLIRQIVPEEILKWVYEPLSPELFAE